MLETVITQTQPPNKVKSTAFRRHSPEIPSGRHYYGYAGVETLKLQIGTVLFLSTGQFSRTNLAINSYFHGTQKKRKQA